METNNIPKSLVKDEDLKVIGKRIDALAADIRRQKSSPINLSRAIITQGDFPVIYPNTITVIQGKTGTHKSRVAQNIVSALITASVDSSNRMGFARETGKEAVAVYIDTERNYRDQFPLAIQSMLQNAGFRIDEDPDNFEYYSFIKEKRSIRGQLLNQKLSELRQKHHGKHLVVVLDVITDFVNSFNDDNESMEIIDYLNAMCNSHEASVIAVIHENPTPGSKKARGHLGTELSNKATNVLQMEAVERKPGTFALNVLKSRNGALAATTFFMYNDEQGNLAQVHNSGNEQKHRNSVLLVQKNIQHVLLTDLPRKKLLESLATVTRRSEETIDHALAEIEAKKLPIQHSLSGTGLLRSKRAGKEKVFYFEKISESSKASDDDQDEN